MRSSLRKIPEHHRPHGFTLLEVLVALTIFAITAAAMHHGIASAVSAHAHMKNKVLAHWIAQNLMAETRFLAQWPSTGMSNGDVEMAGHTWYYERKVEETSDKLLRRVDFEIKFEQEDEYVLARLSGFITEKPVQLAAPGGANLKSDGTQESDPSVDNPSTTTTEGETETESSESGDDGT